MGLDFILVIALIAVFSVVQSVFGMGVLVFGTPTLLLLGYDFIEAIGYLIPASFVISVLQVFTPVTSKVSISRNLYIVCLPAIGIGLWLVQINGVGSWLHYIIGATLLVSAVLRVWGRSPKWLFSILKRYSAAYHLIMGLIHGLTNLGGALLAILASSLSSEKEVVRRIVAHYYLAFGVIQVVILVVLFDQGEKLINNLPIAGVAAVIYFLVGNRLFMRTSNPVYYYGLTVFTAVYGIVVLITN